jgi:hypothetical protein
MEHILEESGYSMYMWREPGSRINTPLQTNLEEAAGVGVSMAF